MVSIAQLEMLARFLTLFGTYFCYKSIRQTFIHSTSPLFEAPKYPKGPKHPRYHAWRGGTLAVAAIVSINMYMWSTHRERVASPFLNLIVIVIAIGYFGGWWPPASRGLKAPYSRAENNHRAAAISCCMSILIINPLMVSWMIDS